MSYYIMIEDRMGILSVSEGVSSWAIAANVARHIYEDFDIVAAYTVDSQGAVIAIFGEPDCSADNNDN